MIFRYLFLGIVLLFSRVVLAQEKSIPAVLKSGIELGSGFSFTGINANLAYTLSWSDNLLFAGPKLVISDSYLPSGGPWGIHLGYRRKLPGQGNFRAFASFEYQVIFIKPYNPNNLDVSGLNRVNEYHFSYGLQYQWNERMSIGNSLGAGWYTENLLDLDDGKWNAYHGFSPQVRIFLSYYFKKKQ